MFTRKLFDNTEANNEANELFGEARMIDALNRNTGKNAKDTLLSMQEEIDGFVKKAPQSDDITMLCLRYNGGGINAHKEAVS